jgi:hypothetical protein
MLERYQGIFHARSVPGGEVSDVSMQEWFDRRSPE